MASSPSSSSSRRQRDRSAQSSSPAASAAGASAGASDSTQRASPRIGTPRHPASPASRAAGNRPSRPSSSSSSNSARQKSLAFDFRALREATPRLGEIGTNKHGKLDVRKPNQLKKNAHAEPHILKLPCDLLVKCFLKLDSVLQIVTCALVCKEWRNKLQLDVLWMELYLRWHSDKMAFLEKSLPPGFTSWREAFIKNFSQGRDRILKKTIFKAIEAGFLRYRGNSSSEAAVIDFTPEISFQRLVEDLHLAFYMRVNRAQQIRLSAKHAVVFPASCILQYPFNNLRRGLKLSSIVSLELIVSSDRLSCSATVAQIVIGKASLWNIISSSAPLRLLQLTDSGATNIVLGTLVESMDMDDSTIQHEEVLFINVGLHLAEVVSKIMRFENAFRHRVQVEPDPLYGLQGYHVSLQLHTFDKLIWTRDFHGAFWEQRESIPGEAAVLLLISSFGEVVPKRLSLPWRSQAFSGEVEHSLVVSITLWDLRSELIWQVVRICRLEQVPVPTVEYGLPDFEGVQLQTTIADKRRGLSTSIKCSVPVYELEAVFAITDLRVSLSSKFLHDWFGISNI